ncbi:hypothetical protein B0H14DRAFT_3522998 [Mycena olivaceomarginata]|nr:hypothetical protein B0H14DRAFT_3522998 [Mycena olivaceomarginata]
MTPELFTEYMRVDEEGQAELLYQLNLIRTNARIGKVGLVWKRCVRMPPSLIRTMPDEVLPALEREYEEIMQELEQQRAEVSIAEKNVEIEALQAEVAESNAQLQWLQEQLEELERGKRGARTVIADTNPPCLHDGTLPWVWPAHGVQWFPVAIEPMPNPNTLPRCACALSVLAALVVFNRAHLVSFESKPGHTTAKPLLNTLHTLVYLLAPSPRLRLHPSPVTATPGWFPSATSEHAIQALGDAILLWSILGIQLALCTLLHQVFVKEAAGIFTPVVAPKAFDVDAMLCFHVPFEHLVVCQGFTLFL